MKLFTWVDSVIKRFRWYDISLIKMSVFASTLLLVKLWPQLLGAEWYWYLAVAILFAIPVWTKMCRQD